MRTIAEAITAMKLTLFVILLQSGHNVGGTTDMRDDIVFVDIGPVEGLEENEDIPLEAH